MSEGPKGIDTPLRRATSLGTAQVIRSPEQVALDLQVAGPMSRMLAFSLDYGLILLFEAAVFTALMMLAISLASLEQLGEAQLRIEELQSSLGEGDFDPGPWFLLMLAAWVALDFVMQWGYFVVCELLMQGRSPGKAWIGMRVVRDGGLPVTLRESMLRNLLRAVDMLPAQYLVGFTSMIFSKEVRRLGDYAAGTIVIREERAEPARPIVLPEGPAPGAPAFRFDRDQLAALGPLELRLVRQTLRRLDELPTWKAREVLGRTVAALSARIGWQEPLEPRDWREFLVSLLRDAERG